MSQGGQEGTMLVLKLAINVSQAIVLGAAGTAVAAVGW